MASENTVAAQQRISDIENEPCKMLLPIEGYEELPLLPIGVAVEPLEHIIPNIGRNAWIAKERTDETPPDGLTQDESASIHLYTMEWKSTNHSLYLDLNAALRAQDRDLLVPYFRYLKLILSGLWKLPSVKKTVWRGVKADVNAKYVVGKTFVWWGFSSCTESLTLLESEKFLGKSGTRTLFNIECESGKEIRRHSYFQQENEVLVLPGTQFQVIGKINPASDLHIIHVREIKPPFPLLQPPSIQASTSAKPTTSDASHQPNSKSTAIAKLYPPTAANTDLPAPNSAIYLNEKLTVLIQQKAKLPFAEFRERQLNDGDAQLIANELATNNRWEGLNLAENNIGDLGAASFNCALQTNIKLNFLNMETNQLGDHGAIYLASALRVNRTLRICVLRDNAIGDSGMIALAQALENNSTLKNLQLARNKITDRSLAAIKRTVLRNERFLSLHLQNNLFSAEGYSELYQIGKQSKTSVYIN